MITNYWKWGVVLAIALQAGGCFTDSASSSYGYVTPVQPSQDPVEPAQSSTRLSEGDKVKVVIYGEETLSGDYEIAPTGFISMPLAGSIKAAGLTSTELQHEITNKYRGTYLQDPKVTVDVVQYRPYFVMGEAVKPGEYPYHSGLNVLTAIATAGGFTYRASKSTILIQHDGQIGWQEYPMSSSIHIMPGDLIRVPERYF